jgi:hypothetical protein
VLSKDLHRSREALTIGKAILVLVTSLLVLESGEANAGIILSTQDAAELPGLSFGNGDLVDWDGTTATMFMADPFSGSGGNVDAAHLLANGNIILSAASDGESIGSDIYQEGDLIEYDPSTGGSSLFFDEALFTPSADSWRPDIDAVFVQADGQIILSTRDTEELGGLTFLDGDLILYDPIGDTASFFLQEALVFDGGNAEIDAVHVLSNGHILLSTEQNESIGGQAFEPDDVIDYNPSNGNVTIVFDGSNFTASDENVDAVMVPEPRVPALLGLGLMVLAAMAQRSPKAL